MSGFFHASPFVPVAPLFTPTHHYGTSTRWIVGEATGDNAGRMVTMARETDSHYRTLLDWHALLVQKLSAKALLMAVFNKDPSENF